MLECKGSKTALVQSSARCLTLRSLKTKDQERKNKPNGGIITFTAKNHLLGLKLEINDGPIYKYLSKKYVEFHYKSSHKRNPLSYS